MYSTSTVVLAIKNINIGNNKSIIFLYIRYNYNLNIINIYAFFLNIVQITECSRVSHFRKWLTLRTGKYDKSSFFV